MPHVKESSEVTSGTGSVKKMEPGSCLDSTCGNGEHTCDGRSCVRIQSFQKEDLVTWFEDITEREKSEIQIVAECYASTTVNLATALGFFSRMCSLQSLEKLESEHHLVTTLSVESWPGVVASDPETHQELEGWTRSGDGISHERSLWSASKCEVPSGVSDGQPMWQPLSITHGDGGSIQPKGIDRQSLLSAQMRKTGSDVASFTQAVEEDPRNSAERTEGRFE